MVVVKATATIPWHATADVEEQQTVKTLLEELAPAEPEAQRQEDGAANDDESAARWAVRRSKHSRNSSRPGLGEPGWSVTNGRFGPLADGEWTTREGPADSSTSAPAEECMQGIPMQQDGDERKQDKMKGLFGVYNEDFLPQLLAIRPPSLTVERRRSDRVPRHTREWPCSKPVLQRHRM